jgi:flagellin
MVSINNTAGNSAVLASLRQINKDIATNQTRIGTGLKINNYSDNAALYTTAQSIRTSVKTQETLSSNIGLSKARADAAGAGLDKIANILTKISDIATTTTATSTAAEVSIASSKITSYLSQITALTASSGFQGTNLIKGSATETVKLSTETGASIAFAGADLETGTAYADMKTDAVGATTGTLIAALSTKVTAALAEVVGLQAQVSSFSEMLGSQLDFQTTLKGINEAALSSIVDANLEEESAKSTALQVKQQLAYQALSIGNSSAQNVLRLFQ